MDRREFLQACVALFTPSLFVHGERESDTTTIDETHRLIERKFQYARAKKLHTQPIAAVVVAMAKTFLGTPYRAYSLENPDREELVIDLTGVDCVTLYEYALVFARCIKKGTPTFDAFRAEVEFVRYRHGVLNGYASRLHYTSDYFYDNERKNVLRDVTRELGGVRFNKRIHFMTSHRTQYPQLRDESTYKVMLSIEEEINSRMLYHIPRNRVRSIEQKIQNGDIVAVTTTREGLDCKHTGIALWQKNALHLLHAPSPGKVVQVTQEPLWRYVMKYNDAAGIMVARPMEV